MSPLQKSLYWREWSACKKALSLLGYTTTLELEAQRHRLHIDALGRDASSKTLKNAELDRILAKFRSFSRPDDLTAQLKQLDQPEQRMEAYRARALALADEIGVEEHGHTAYLDSLARRVCGRSWERLHETEVAKICGILDAQALRHRRAVAKAATTDLPENPF